MHRRRGRGGRPARAAQATPYAFDGIAVADSVSSSDTERGVEDNIAGTPASLVAAAAAAAAARAAKRAAREDGAAVEVGYKDEGGGGAAQREPPPEPEARESRYIEKLVRQAAVRKDIADAAFERKLAREREKEDGLYEGKERFVTARYKEKLAQRAQAERDEDSITPATATPVTVSVVDGELGKRLLEAQKRLDAHGGEWVDDFGQRAKRRRWGDAARTGEGGGAGGEARGAGKEEKPTKALRGLRRNDETAIEVYRQRYFARRDAGESERGGGSICP